MSSAQLIFPRESQLNCARPVAPLVMAADVDETVEDALDGEFDVVGDELPDLMCISMAQARPRYTTRMAHSCPIGVSPALELFPRVSHAHSHTYRHSNNEQHRSYAATEDPLPPLNPTRPTRAAEPSI